MSRTGRVVVWLLLGFILLVTAGSGAALLMHGVNGSRALAEGTAGTFTPTGRSCSRNACTWEGTFASNDRTVTVPGVQLHDDEDVRRSTPMPASIGNVRLVHNRDEPAVYTHDFSSSGSIVGGVAIVVAGLAITSILFVVKRRHDAKFRPGVPAPFRHS